MLPMIDRVDRPDSCTNPVGREARTKSTEAPAGRASGDLDGTSAARADPRIGWMSPPRHRRQVDSADVFQRVVGEVDELLRAEVERLLTVGGASGADDVRTELTRELRHHRPDCAGRAVHEDALAR